MEELILRSLQGQATPEEEARLHAWRLLSPANDRRFRSIERIWSATVHGKRAVRRLEAVPDPIDLIGMAEDEDRVVPIWAAGAEDPGGTARRGRATGPASRRGQSATPASRRSSLLWRAAAVAAVLLPAGLGLGLLIRASVPGPLAVVSDEIRTGQGEMTTLTLDDGTSIRVGPRSRLRVSRSPEGLVADLDGRAFFAVAPDPSRTFVVRTDLGDAVVLGTRFEVRSEDEEFRVLVVDGSVRVSAGDASAEIGEAQLSRSQKDGPLTIQHTEDVYAQLDWMGKTLVFKATPLIRAIREIERHYAVTIRLGAPALGDLTVTATFTDEDVESVILVLCETIDVRCSVRDDVVVIGADDARAAPLVEHARGGAS